MSYVDGFVLAMPKKNLAAYKKMAKDGGKVWMKYGALNYVEAVADDMASAKKWGNLPFPVMIKAKKNEIIVFAYIVYKNRKHRDSVNKKVYAHMSKTYDPAKDGDMPFEMDRAAMGGFETIVDL